MATVRLTKRLKYDIENNVRSTASDQRTKMPLPDRKLVRKALMEFATSYKLFNSHLNSEVETVSLLGGDKVTVLVSITPIDMIIPVLCHTCYGADKVIKMTIDDPGILDETRDELIKQFSKYRRNIDEINKFEDIINQTLERCTTLKQLMEAWEPIKDYVPQAALDKHFEEEKTKRKKGVYLDEDALDTLNHVSLTSKIT